MTGFDFGVVQFVIQLEQLDLDDSAGYVHYEDNKKSNSIWCIMIHSGYTVYTVSNGVRSS